MKAYAFWARGQRGLSQFKIGVDALQAVERT